MGRLPSIANVTPAEGPPADDAIATADVRLLQIVRLLESLGEDEAILAEDVLSRVLGQVRDAHSAIRQVRDAAMCEAAFEHLYNAVVVTDADFDGGPFIRRCNPAFCALTGYSEEELVGKSPRILQGADTDRQVIDRLRRQIRAGEFFQGSTINYRKDGAPYAVQWNISPICGADGAIVAYVSIQQDITALIEANERNRVLGQEVQWHAERLASELNSAARYAASILPHGLTGPVNVSSHYLPVRGLGGDSFDYLWLDDDHLVVYLIDVSGHGVEPALLSISVHNMLRSRAISDDALLQPEDVLTELNHRSQMDQHNEHFFTIWYGVYEASRRELRYASAGAPPVLVFDSASAQGVVVTDLPSTSPPVGVFEDTTFRSRTHHVPIGSRALVYSDGAYEIDLSDDRQLSWEEFVNLTGRVAACPAWTLDDLVDELRGISPSGTFQDDCSLIQLTFD